MLERGRSTSDNDAVQLILHPIYAAVIHLRGERGDPLRCDPLLFGSLSWHMDDERAVSLLRKERMPELDFVGPARLFQMLQNVRDDKVVVYHSNEVIDALGPLTFTANIPGYETKTEMLQVSFADSEPEEFEVRLRAIARAWGGLVARVTGPPAVIPASSSDARILGFVYLYGEKWDPTTSHRVEYRFAMTEPGTQSLELDGVPAGEYQWRFVAEPGGWAYPRHLPRGRLGEAIVILPGRTAELLVPLDGSGALEVSIVSVNGSPYSGSAELMLVRDDRSIFPRFHRMAPHVIGGLTPARYDVRVLEAMGRRLEEPPQVIVEVIGDTRAYCTLRLPEL